MASVGKLDVSTDVFTEMCWKAFYLCWAATHFSLNPFSPHVITPKSSAQSLNITWLSPPTLWERWKTKCSHSEGFPLTCKPLNNCQPSNMQQKQQHCMARNNAGFWGSLSQRFWREVVMDVAVVIESGAPLTLALAFPVTSDLYRGRRVFVRTVSDRHGADSFCLSTILCHTETHTYTNTQWKGCPQPSAPQIQQKKKYKKSINQTATEQTTLRFYCSICSRELLHRFICCFSHNPSDLFWARVKICVWSIIVQPRLKGQTSSQSLPASTYIHPTQNQEHSLWRASNESPSSHWRPRFWRKGPKIYLWGSECNCKRKKKREWFWNMSTQPSRGKLMRWMFMDLWRREMLMVLWQEWSCSRQADRSHDRFLGPDSCCLHLYHLLLLYAVVGNCSADK